MLKFSKLVVFISINLVLIFGGKDMDFRKRLIIFNFFIALIGLLIFIFSLIKNTNLIRIWMPLLSFTIIFGGWNTIDKGQLKFIGYLTLSIGIFLMLWPLIWI